MLPLPPDLFADADAALNWAARALKTAAEGGNAAHDVQDSWQHFAIAYTPPPPPHEPAPSMKTVVLRGVGLSGGGPGTLTFYTDTRSGKWAGFGKNPSFQALFYCPQRWVQLSVRGHVTLETQTPRCQGLFAGLSEAQKQAYTSAADPGTVMGTVMESALDSPPLKIDDPGLSARYFGVVACQAQALDFVSLHRRGHQRVVAAFKNGHWQSHWAVP